MWTVSALPFSVSASSKWCARLHSNVRDWRGVQWNVDSRCCQSCTLVRLVCQVSEDMVTRGGRHWLSPSKTKGEFQQQQTQALAEEWREVPHVSLVPGEWVLTTHWRFQVGREPKVAEGRRVAKGSSYLSLSTFKSATGKKGQPGGESTMEGGWVRELLNCSASPCPIGIEIQHTFKGSCPKQCHHHPP